MNVDSSTTRRRRFGRPLAIVAAVALSLGGVLAAAPAQAATAGAVTDAVFEWGFNKEAGGGAFFGGCNFLSAGIAGDTGASRPWTQADGFYQASAGNVSILKDGPNGTRIAPTWATKCQDGSGTAVSAGNTASATNNTVKITGGAGERAADGSLEVAWDGDFSVVFYGGMTYWTASDPKLALDAAGNGQLTATASGYGADMNDTSKWVRLDPREIVLADISGGSVTDTGVTVTPDYLGVTVTTVGTPQATGTATSGSFPQSFIDFQNLTGQSSYWYSSGGSRDAAKPATPVSVSYTVAPVAGPTVSVSKSSGIARAGETITVNGSGFLPDGTATNATTPPLAGSFGGTYVVFGKFLDAWKPSESAPSSARKAIDTKWAVPADKIATVGGAGRGAIELRPDGTFTAELTVSASEANDLLAGNYGIYTYGGGSSKYAGFETYTPVTFSGADDVVVEVPEWVDAPTGSFGWAFAGTSPADLGTATQDGATFVANGSLTDIVVTDTRAGGTAAYTWSISGQAGDFTTTGGASFSGALLGWSPKIVAGGSTVAKGADVTSTQLGGTGLGTSRVLASSTAAASATVGADLSLVIPSTTAPGDYTSTLTITALQ